MENNSIIETRHLSFAIGSTQILKDVSLSVPRGSLFGFLGPNGAGKTTLRRMLLNLYQTKHDSVFLFGEDVTKNRLSVLKRLGRFVEQPTLYGHLTGEENLRIAQSYYGTTKSSIDEVLETVGMTYARKRLVKKYSLGMKQRIAIAQALIHNPELLILDEPTNGLDPNGIKEIRELLIKLNTEKGITIFVSSHMLAEIERMCSHVGLIHNGELVFQGALNQLTLANSKKIEVKVSEVTRAKQLLQTQGFIAIHNNNSTLELDVESEKQAASINRYLVEQGIDIYKLNYHEQNLEDVFMALTNFNK